MCGIVGAVAQRNIVPVLLEGLRRLEYRGYDSCGVPVHQQGLKRSRSVARVAELAAQVESTELTGHTGIAHTRWATHGAPAVHNAHPHFSHGPGVEAGNGPGRVALVHNGIIENFRALREELAGKGHAFESETDTEVAVHLVTHYLGQGLNPVDAAMASVKRLTGAFALVMIFKDEESLLIGARRGSPLAVGYGDKEAYLGSDAFALAPFTNRVAYLEDGDIAVVNGAKVAIYDAHGKTVSRPVHTTAPSAAIVDKGNQRHFMAKEIHEQPEVVGHTFARYIDASVPAVDLPTPEAMALFAQTPKLTISACGTAFYAGLIGKYWFEQLARLPVEADIASELRYQIGRAHV